MKNKIFVSKSSFFKYRNVITSISWVQNIANCNKLIVRKH